MQIRIDLSLKHKAKELFTADYHWDCESYDGLGNHYCARDIPKGGNLDEHDRNAHGMHSQLHHRSNAHNPH